VLAPKVPAQWLMYCDCHDIGHFAISLVLKVPAQWIMYCDRSRSASSSGTSAESACAVAGLLRRAVSRVAGKPRLPKVPAQWLIDCDRAGFGLVAFGGVLKVPAQWLMYCDEALRGRDGTFTA